MLRATTACTFSTSQLPKVLWTPQFLTLLTSKCASRHNRMHFFDISTSKSGPVFLCAFNMLTSNVLRATTVRTCSTSQLPKVLWTRQFFTLLTSKRASRHNRMHFFDISTSKSGPVFLRAFNMLTSNVLRATTVCTCSTSQLPKVLWTRQFFTLLTSKRASRHNGAHLFDIYTSESGPNM